MSDSIKELTVEICAFRDARDWAQFHNPKEMAVAIAAEAGELLQHFVWQDAEQSLERISARRAEIESETPFQRHQLLGGKRHPRHLELERSAAPWTAS
jgi:hypothetical protein